MARIANVNVPDKKRVEIALTYIYGIGRSVSRKILKEANINLNTKVADLTEDELSRLRSQITEKYQVEGDLAQANKLNINRLKETGSYRGSRHKVNLPVRGQRTRTNARAKRGKRVTVGSGRKKAPTPT